MPIECPAETLQSRTMASPIGTLTLFASMKGVRAITCGTEDPTSFSGLGSALIQKSGRSGVLDRAERQIGEYFSGKRRTFDIDLDPVGTEFQLAAWKVLSTIPYGHTITYGDQARALGDARKARAVGGANGRNPIPIIVPCHRVIGSDGSLTGFAIGTDVKKFLLELERGHAHV